MPEHHTLTALVAVDSVTDAEARARTLAGSYFGDRPYRLTIDVRPATPDEAKTDDDRAPFTATVTVEPVDE